MLFEMQAERRPLDLERRPPQMCTFANNKAHAIILALPTLWHVKMPTSCGTRQVRKNHRSPIARASTCDGDVAAAVAAKLFATAAGPATASATVAAAFAVADAAVVTCTIAFVASLVIVSQCQNIYKLLLTAPHLKEWRS